VADEPVRVEQYDRSGQAVENAPAVGVGISDFAGLVGRRGIAVRRV
jgi:hypothetical protein